MQDDRQQMSHSYDQKDDVLHSEIILPEGAPDWAKDRQQLWNRVDAAEKRKDAMTAREILLSLPRELDRQQQIDLVRNFVQDNFTARGLVADIALHEPAALDGDRQPHAHIMSSDRPLDRAGFAAKKDRTLNQPENIEALRESWASHVNTAMERAGLGERVDHRSLARQRQTMLMVVADNTKSPQEREEANLRAKALDRHPEPKIGSVALQMAKTGRSEQAHAFQAAMQARQERSLLEKAWQGWREIKTEAFALAERVNALFQSKTPPQQESALPTAPKEDRHAALKQTLERINAQMQRDREQAAKRRQEQANDLFGQMSAAQDAYFAAKKHGAPIPLQTYKAQQETLLGSIHALGLDELKPKLAAITQQFDRQLQKETARVEREKQERAARRVDPTDRSILKPQQQQDASAPDRKSSESDHAKLPQQEIEAEKPVETPKEVQKQRSHKQRM
jgi:hypothetical protein